jgi:hypothetical protein
MSLKTDDPDLAICVGHYSWILPFRGLHWSMSLNGI